VTRAPLLLFALLAAACTRQDLDNAGSALASAAPKLASDGIVVARIEARLVQLDADSALHVAVSSRDGVVRLSGKVRSTAIAARFVAAARAIPGVTRVDSALAAAPHMPRAEQNASDFALAVAVRASLIAQGGINAFGVRVAAHDGAVTLTGKVKSESLRQTLVDAAKHSPGVKSVVDKIEVKS